MKNSDNRSNISRIYCCIYFFWGLWLQFENTVNINIANVINIGRAVNVFLLILISGLIFFSIINNKSQLHEIGILSIFVYLGIISGLHDAGLISLCTFLMAYFAKNVSIEDILKTFVLFTGLTLIVVIWLNHIKVIPDALQFYGINTLRTRNSLGFKYYGFAGELFFYFTCSYLIIRNKKVSYLELIILELINYFIFYFTNTRNPYFLITIFILFSFVVKIFNFGKNILNIKVIRLFIEYVFPICFSFLLILTFLLPSNLFQKLNLMLSNRLILNVNGFNNYGISLFGKKIIFTTMNIQGMVDTNYNYVDSSYLQALFLNGALYLLLILIISVYLCKKMVNRNDYFFCFALLLMAIHAMFDPPLLWIWFSPFCLILGYAFNRDEEY